MTKKTIWNVKTVSGAAGGCTRQAEVALRIECESDTVEAVRRKVEALPELLEACHAALKSLMDDYADAILDTCQGAADENEFFAIRGMLKAAIARATGQED